MKEYSSYLGFNEIDEECIDLIKGLAKKYRLEVDIGGNYFDFDYVVRDTTRHVVRFLFELSLILENCEGEIVCEIENDEGDNTYEFYSIKNGELICQAGVIVRGEKEKICFRLDVKK